MHPNLFIYRIVVLAPTFIGMETGARWGFMEPYVGDCGSEDLAEVEEDTCCFAESCGGKEKEIEEGKE